MLKYKIIFIYREGFMKLLFSFIFLFFISFQVQAQAQAQAEFQYKVLIDYYNNSSNRKKFDWADFPKKNLQQMHIEYINYRIDQFDWESFANKETLKKHIEHRNQTFNKHTIGIPVIFYLDKIYLVRIEQELKLYDMGIKKGLSAELIQAAKEAIALHWENINSKENQSKAYAGLGSSADVSIIKPKDRDKRRYYKGIWNLYTADYEIVFNMVNKGDKRLYKDLGSNDEFYVKFITPYLKRHLKKMQDIAQAYYNSLGGELDYEATRTLGQYYYYKNIKKPFKNLNLMNLTDMYLHSLKVYNSFVENFKTPIAEHQEELMKTIEDWHTNQAFLGIDSWIDSYKIYEVDVMPVIVVARLRKFYEAPMEVKEKATVFLRNDVLYNEKFINTNDEYLLNARVNALIGLHALGVATVEEENLYDQAVEKRIIAPRDRVNSYASRSVPLPDVTNKAIEQRHHRRQELSFNLRISNLQTRM